MEYICYIDRERSDVPFMDIIHADTLADARDLVRILMSQRSDSLGARMFVGEDLVDTIPSFWGALEAQA
ncbi:MAG TPA: hypothetical protein VLJ13_02885 [Brevundimonas sp.]|nr:hypothetical protein [Brevundimonas sp.]